MLDSDDDRRLLDDSVTSDQQRRPRLFDQNQQPQQRRVQFDDEVTKRQHSLTADLSATKYDIGMYVCQEHPVCCQPLTNVVHFFWLTVYHFHQAVRLRRAIVLPTDIVDDL